MHEAFYNELLVRAGLVVNRHPIGDNLTSPRFMQWWDSLSPQDRKALEDNIDARFKVLEEWKIQCQKSPSPTPPTQLCAEASSATSASGQTLGPVESPAPHSGSSSSPSKD